MRVELGVWTSRRERVLLLRVTRSRGDCNVGVWARLRSVLDRASVAALRLGGHGRRGLVCAPVTSHPFSIKTFLGVGA
jgi:hypothetical protein